MKYRISRCSFALLAAIASTASAQTQVQLGAYASRAQAEAGWLRLKPAYSALARDLPSFTDGPGTIQLGVNRPNEHSARQLCASLRANGVTCFVAGQVKELGPVAPATGAVARVSAAAPKNSSPASATSGPRSPGAPITAPASAAPQLVGAATVFAYHPASAYPLNGKPGFITTIVLEPGEKLLSKALGEPGSWAINEALQGTGGAGFASQQLIYVKPKAAGASTNLVLTTDRRSYQIELTSNRKLPRTRLLAWNFAPAQVASSSRKGSPQ